MSALVFTRAQVGLEQFASVIFTISIYSTCLFRKPTRSRQKVWQDFEILSATAAKCARFCEMERFADVTTQADAELGYPTVETSTPTKMFMSLSDIGRKVILFEPPVCKARSEARVQCWTEGRV